MTALEVLSLVLLGWLLGIATTTAAIYVIGKRLLAARPEEAPHG